MSGAKGQGPFVTANLRTLEALMSLNSLPEPLKAAGSFVDADLCMIAAKCLKKCQELYLLPCAKPRRAVNYITTQNYHNKHNGRSPFFFKITPHLRSLPSSAKPASMAKPLQDCVIALSGKFEETHGKPNTKVARLVFNEI